MTVSLKADAEYRFLELERQGVLAEETCFAARGGDLDAGGIPAQDIAAFPSEDARTRVRYVRDGRLTYEVRVGPGCVLRNVALHAMLVQHDETVHLSQCGAHAAHWHLDDGRAAHAERQVRSTGVMYLDRDGRLTLEENGRVWKRAKKPQAGPAETKLAG